jgi:hypothetical protein
MPDRSRPRLTLLATALAVPPLLAGCGLIELGEDMRAGKAGRLVDTTAEQDAMRETGEEGPRVVPGTKAEAQALVDEAERSFLDEASARFDVWWIGGGEVEIPIEGSFDVAQPATELTIGPDEDNRFEMRLRGEDTWLRMTMDGRSMECWMHLTGSAEDGGPAGVPYQALLLLEPVALGRLEPTDAGQAAVNGYDSVEDQVVVELRLDEALPAALPKPGGPTAEPIDPKARVRAVANVGVNGRYASIAYDLADLVDALAASRGGVPKELRGLVAEPTMREVQVRIDYHDYGSLVEVEAPPRAKVADFGAWSDLLAGLEDPAALDPGSAPSCAAALRGA